MPPYKISPSDVEVADLALQIPTPILAVTRLPYAAIWAAESLHYLADIDETRFGGPWVADGHSNRPIDDAHMRWAATSAITALDLLAAALGRIHGLKQGRNELSMRDLDPNISRPREPCGATRFPQLDPKWQTWVRGVVADARYSDVLAARNPLTHADSPRVAPMTTRRIVGHSLRWGHQFGTLDDTPAQIMAAQTVQARPIIEAARDLATRHAESFLATALL